VLQEVQRHALAGKDRPGPARQLRHGCIRRQVGAVGQLPLHRERRVDEPEDGRSHGGPGQHPTLFAEDPPPGGQLRSHDPLGGDVAAAARRAEVLGQGAAGELFNF